LKPCLAGAKAKLSIFQRQCRQSDKNNKISLTLRIRQYKILSRKSYKPYSNPFSNMNDMNLESQWSGYAASKRAPKNSIGARPAALGGLLAATGAAVFSLPSHANASIIYSGATETLTWNNSAGGCN